MPNIALGVDIGGVLIRPARSGGDTSFFSSGYLQTPEVAGGFEAVRRLNHGPFVGAVYLVSKAKSGTARKTREWLQHRDFYNRTGVPPERLHFCERREDKAPIAKRLGLTAFIDDRVDVLEHLTMVEERILFAEAAEWVSERAAASGFAVCVGWEAVLARLVGTA